MQALDQVRQEVLQHPEEHKVALDTIKKHILTGRRGEQEGSSYVTVKTAFMIPDVDTKPNRKRIMELYTAKSHDSSRSTQVLGYHARGDDSLNQKTTHDEIQRTLVGVQMTNAIMYVSEYYFQNLGKIFTYEYSFQAPAGQYENFLKERLEQKQTPRPLPTITPNLGQTFMSPQVTRVQDDTPTGPTNLSFPNNNMG